MALDIRKKEEEKLIVEKTKEEKISETELPKENAIEHVEKKTE
jgi:hypothetical protein